jgi:hypothetical protein
MSKCKETKTLDFKNPNSILSALKNLFKLPSKPGSGIPGSLVLAKQCGGFNASEIAAKIIKRQAEAGIPVGPLPSGEISPDEIMERIRVEEMVDAITTKMVMDVAIQPGTALQATGTAGPIPVVAAGTVVGIATGKAVVNPCA